MKSCDTYITKNLESHYANDYWIFMAKNTEGDKKKNERFTLVSVLLSTELHSVRFSSIPPSSNPRACTDCCKFLKYRIRNIHN